MTGITGSSRAGGTKRDRGDECTLPLTDLCCHHGAADADVDDDDGDSKYRKHNRKRKMQRCVTIRAILPAGLLVMATALLVYFMRAATTTTTATTTTKATTTFDDNNARITQLSDAQKTIAVNMVKAYTMAKLDQDTDQTIDDFKAEMQQIFPSLSNHDMDSILDDAIAAKRQEAKPTIDKHLLNLAKVEKECMGKGVELDASSPDYDPDEAAYILRHCKLLVLRNALPRDWITTALKKRVRAYLEGLHTKRVPHAGRTTNGERFHFSSRDVKRWEVLLTESMVRDTKKELMMNPLFTDVLKYDAILGNQCFLHSAGTNFASPGAVGQMWHEDEQYLFDEQSFMTTGTAGHDVPSYAVTVSIPLLDMTGSHGPTEFCMGSSTLNGIDVWNDHTPKWLADNGFVRDPELAKNGSAFERFTRYGYSGCHSDFWQSPLLKMGDVLFFDYQLKHRGGWNTSPEARAILFLTFSRFWFRDSNFWASIPTDLGDAELEEFMMLRGTRLAMPADGLWNETEYLEKYFAEHGNETRDLTELGPIDDTYDVEGTKMDIGSDTEHTFLVTNKNVESRSSPVHLFLNEVDLGELVAGQTMEAVQGRVGDILSLRIGNEKLFDWPLHYKGQVIFHNEMGLAPRM
jgi:ectoine hydroxylase-related dioxygenase (phytanoyl-CoA dioxygenase family)